jgi:thiosulfate dehydrogenase
MVRSFFLGMVASIVLGVVAVYLVIQSGLVPANADATAGGLETWAANTSLGATLRSQAPKGPNPVPLTDANLLLGVKLYGDHCAICHGTATGAASASPLAKGEYPRPPQLGTEGVEDDPEGFTFWKIQHGVRLTGMPSWKGALTEREMWTLALFLKHMDKLPAGPEAAWKQISNAPKP